MNQAKARPGDRTTPITILLVLTASWLSLPSQAQVQEAWSRTYSGGGRDGAVAMALDQWGNAFVTGYSVQGDDYDWVTLKYSPDGTELWAQRYVGPDDAADEPSALAVTAAGEVWVTGLSQGTNGVTSWTLVKYDPDGNVLWTERLEGLDQVTPGWRGPPPTGVVVDSLDDGYVVGPKRGVGSYDEILVVKYSANGGQLWEQSIGLLQGARDVHPTALALDEDGNLIVTGYVSGERDPYDILTVKFAPDGTLVFQARYDGDGNNEIQGPQSVCADRNGNVLVTGSRSTGIGLDFLTLKYSPDGTLLWDAIHSLQPGALGEGSAVRTDASDNVYVVGAEIYATAGQWNYDLTTIKYDPNGSPLWRSRYPGAGGYPNSRTRLALDGADNLYVADPSQLVTVKYSADGGLLWAATKPSAGFPTALAVDANAGDVFLAGQLEPLPASPDDQGDFVTVKYQQNPSPAQPHATISPSPAESIIGSNVLLRAAVSGPGPFTFQWRFNGRPIVNEIDSKLLLSPLVPAAAGDYSVIVSNAAGYTITPETQVILHTPPTFVSVGQTNSVVAGEDFAWQASVYGDPPLTLYWVKNGAVLPGALDSMLTFSALQPNDSGLYWLVASNAYGVAVSQPYQLTVVPQSLELIRQGTWTSPNPISFALAVRVVGDRAYLADARAGLQILNVIDPEHPTRLGGYATDGYALDVDVAGDLAYLADSSAGLIILEVRDPANPARLGRYDSGSSGWRFAESPNVLQVVDHLAYLVDGNGDLHIVDVSDPAKPVRIGFYPVPDDGWARGVHVEADRAYLTGSRRLNEDDNIGFLEILDVTDPSSPARLGHVDTASEGYGVAVIGSFAYVVGEAMPLTIVGAGRPEAPVIVKDFEATGWAQSVQIVGPRAYLAGEYLGLLVLDVTNPFEPYRLAQYPYGTGQDEGWDLQVSGNHAYLARGSEGLIIFELGGQPPIESVTRSGQNLILKWTGAPGLRLQRTDSLTTPNWIDVPGSDGQSQATITMRATSEFYRLLKP